MRFMAATCNCNCDCCPFWGTHSERANERAIVLNASCWNAINIAAPSRRGEGRAQVGQPTASAAVPASALAIFIAQLRLALYIHKQYTDCLYSTLIYAVFVCEFRKQPEIASPLSLSLCPVSPPLYGYSPRQIIFYLTKHGLHSLLNWVDDMQRSQVECAAAAATRQDEEE